ncbi:Hsp20/alpha crystallin family protein [Nitrospira sp. Kam-Ns4a]
MTINRALPALVREPFDLQIDRLFDEAFRSLAWEPAVWTPSYNAYEDDNGFCVQFAVPGLEIKDMEITVEDGVLTVKGERKEDASDSRRTYHVREMAWGAFSRSLTLPSSVDHDKGSASLHQGILSIYFPKREEAKPRRIAIECK